MDILKIKKKTKERLKWTTKLVKQKSNKYIRTTIKQT